MAVQHHGADRFQHIFDAWFPMPKALAPRAIGVDISDASIKWLGIEQKPDGKKNIYTHGSLSLPEGIVVRGAIQNLDMLSRALEQIKIASHTAYAHAALPEEEAYVFSMNVPRDIPREQILRLIEFECDSRVPVPVSETVYDFDVIEESGESREIGVYVFPLKMAENYAAVFERAGISPLSLEIEARSIARAVSTGAHHYGHVELLVDFGRARIGCAVLKNGIPIFTSTADIGSDHFVEYIAQKLSLPKDEAERVKNDEGLLASGEYDSVREGIAAKATDLADEIAKHFQFWDTRRDEHGKRVTPVEKVVFVGGGANMKGIADFIAGKVQTPVERGNVWRSIFSFDEEIPPIDRRTSLQFATAAGLALRGL